MSLLISDVPGDDPAVIASGPTVADPTTFADARAVLEHYGIDAPAAVRAHLAAARRRRRSPAIRGWPAPRTCMIASPAASLRPPPTSRGRPASPRSSSATRSRARRARSAGAWPGSPARWRRHGQPAAAARVLLSGGETTVTVRGSGPRRPQRRVPAGAGGRAGRRCRHLGARRRYRRHRRHRGRRRRASSPPTAWRAARRLGIEPRRALADNDGHGFFEALGDQRRHRPDPHQRQRFPRHPDPADRA